MQQSRAPLARTLAATSAVLLATLPALAELAATRPTSGPSSMPTTSNATTSPATTTAARSKFPTPAELIKQMQDAKKVEEAKVQVAFIDLSETFSERPAGGMSIFGGGGGQTFRELIERVQKARDDESIRAILFTMTSGIGLNMAQVQELREEIDAVRMAGKRVFAYADAYDTRSYLLASAATDVCMLQAGEIFMPGIGVETMFYKGVLDKLGVTPDFVQIGEYKGAEEPFTRTAPSEELRAEMEKLTKGLMDQLVDGISGSRSLPADKVRRMMDDAMVMSERAKRDGLVDHLVDIDGLRELLTDELGDEVALQQDYAEKAAPEIDFSNPLNLLTAMASKTKETELPKVAVIYAQGVITDGEDGGGGLPVPGFGGGEGGIASEPFRRAFREALRDDKVKAIVLRIDSPGGSAMASEVLWQSLRRVSKEKPVVVSIGNMAASGGYYLASAGDYIYADAAGIIGSIGVVGGKMALGGLYEKIGLTTTSFTQGENADIYSTTTPWTEAQRRMIKTWMKGTYDQFTQRIMTTREGKIADIDKVARGRIFTAVEAQELGMVDAIGGLQQAITEAAKRGKLGDGEYDLKTLPAPPTLQEMIGKGGAFGMSVPMGGAIVGGEANAILSLMPSDVRESLAETIRLGQLMQKRPVVLMSPYTIRVR